MRLDFPVDGPAFFARFFLGLQPYPWQDEAIQAASLPHSRTALVAANGSGKTACVNVALLLWFWSRLTMIVLMTTMKLSLCHLCR